MTKDFVFNPSAANPGQWVKMVHNYTGLAYIGAARSGALGGFSVTTTLPTGQPPNGHYTLSVSALAGGSPPVAGDASWVVLNDDYIYFDPNEPDQVLDRVELIAPISTVATALPGQDLGLTINPLRVTAGPILLKLHGLLVNSTGWIAGYSCTLSFHDITDGSAASATNRIWTDTSGNQASGNWWTYTEREILVPAGQRVYTAKLLSSNAAMTAIAQGSLSTQGAPMSFEAILR